VGVVVIIFGIVVFFALIDLLFLPRIKHTEQDKRREAYQKRIKEKRANRERPKQEEE